MTTSPPPRDAVAVRAHGVAAGGADSPEEDLALALELADAADAMSLKRFGAGDLHVDAKPDLTPVSDADLAVERALRAIIAETRPDDALLGEEFGTDRRADLYHGRTWVIDPIDGTKNFVRGVPIWATLIALLVDGRPVVGVASAPALARRWWGEIGRGAWRSVADGAPEPCHVSSVAALEDASLSIAQLNSWEEAGLGEQMRALSRRCWRTRGYGDFYSYVLVAEGAVDVAAEPELSLWDLAALGPIVIPAGGAFTTIEGAGITPEATSALATNRLLHEAAVMALAR